MILEQILEPSAKERLVSDAISIIPEYLTARISPSIGYLAFL
jgi:DNA-binding TFAR19-related protein (PDSD5 family)